MSERCGAVVGVLIFVEESEEVLVGIVARGAEKRGGEAGFYFKFDDLDGGGDVILFLAHKEIIEIVIIYYIRIVAQKVSG